MAIWLAIPARSLADALDASWVREDIRLNRLVTISLESGNVADVLADAAKQTGVTLTTGQNDGAGDQELCVSVSKVSLATLMDGIWALFSHRGAHWSWLREKSGDSFVYRLSRPKAARDLAEAIVSDRERLYENSAGPMIRAAHLTGEDRKNAISATPHLDYLDDKQKVVDSLAKSERLWAGLRMFSVRIVSRGPTSRDPRSCANTLTRE